MENRQPHRSVLLAALALATALPLIGGCAHVNLTQIAYEMLRQEDCKMNRLDDFCTRTFAREYLEYERLRQDYLRSQSQKAWRAEQDPITLPASIKAN